MPHPHATRLRTFKTNGVSRRGRWKARKGTSDIAPKLFGRNPRQVPQFHQSSLNLPAFQLLHPPLRIPFKPLITPRSNLTCLRATILILQALPQHRHHLYLYHLVQRMPQEPLYLHPAPHKPWSRQSPPRPSSFMPPPRTLLFPRSTSHSLRHLETCIRASLYIALS